MQESDRQVEANWEQVEQLNVVTRERDRKKRELQDQLNPTRRPLHNLFIGFSGLVCVAAFGMALGQIVGILFQDDGPVQYILRVYVVALCCLAMLVELEWTRFTRDSLILGTWITRGLFYEFIGVLGLQENETASDKNTERRFHDLSIKYTWIVAWIMIVCGAFYFVMGVLCVQLIYNNLRADYEERLERAPEVRRTVDSFAVSENPDARV